MPTHKINSSLKVKKKISKQPITKVKKTSCSKNKSVTKNNNNLMKLIYPNAWNSHFTEAQGTREFHKMFIQNHLKREGYSNKEIKMYMNQFSVNKLT